MQCCQGMGCFEGRNDAFEAGQFECRIQRFLVGGAQETGTACFKEMGMQGTDAGIV
jgi:hypothetical protein